MKSIFATFVAFICGVAALTFVSASPASANYCEFRTFQYEVTEDWTPQREDFRSDSPIRRYLFRGDIFNSPNGHPDGGDVRRWGEAYTPDRTYIGRGAVLREKLRYLRYFC